ncbi:HEAT repeat domain-containing protein [Streptomyces cupreus]|uniref:HEAT repeat domain-containing protein n=1 Tax=Streptomyces cupreus TaxID=2759956 RepID=A0A7X1MDG9_9ACTN|nr:HEAT repeat domain-containing protein [Streptomyces cupreus]MBC2904705.1 HEAT repeat domain-containing protein [Streptomyces cupreus]
MNFSKSHIDRIFKAQAGPHPPRPFTRQFLVLTSRKSGLSHAEHKKAWEEAVSLLDALSELPSRRPTSRGPGPGGIPREATVAELQLRLDLERAQHLETRLRYALRDTRCFVNTLWDIISVLRDVISHHYALRASLLHGGDNSPRLTQIQSETEQALDYKRSAQAEADRAVARIRVLEERWEQACTEAHRLSLHSELADFPADNSVLPGAGPAPLLAQELLARPTLDDIKAALEKARAINAQEEDSARTLQEALSSSGPFAPDDERLVLVAATRLTDADSRRTALNSLAKRWPDHPDTRDLLLHMAHDPEVSVRLAATESLAACWWDDDTACEALVALSGDDDAHVRAAAARSVVAAGWRDEGALDVLLSLARDQNSEVRSCAADGLAAEWTGAPAARDALIQLLLGPGKRFGIRERAVKALLANWPHDDETHNGLLRFADSDEDYDFTAVVVARAALLACWAHDPRARSAVLRLDPGDQFFRYVEREMATRWQGQMTARDSVILMSETHEAAVAEALDTWPSWPPSTRSTGRMQPSARPTSGPRLWTCCPTAGRATRWHATPFCDAPKTQAHAYGGQLLLRCGSAGLRTMRPNKPSTGWLRTTTDRATQQPRRTTRFLPGSGRPATWVWIPMKAPCSTTPQLASWLVVWEMTTPTPSSRAVNTQSSWVSPAIRTRLRGSCLASWTTACATWALWTS